MRLSRDGRAAPPVRLVHLGLGNFFRAHAAWYTTAASDDWGIAAFTGRSSPEMAAHRLDEDEALETLNTLVVDQPRKVFKL